MKKFFSEFKEFAMRGNVMQLAVGVIIGAAFQTIVTSLTGDILSPIIGLLTKKNLDNLEIHFFDATLRYGAFLTAIINFILTALVIFLLVKGMNRLLDGRKKEESPAEPPAPTTKSCPFCCTEIPIAAKRCPACTSELVEA